MPLTREQRRVHTTIAVNAPCQFGHGLHPVTVVLGVNGHLLGVRCGCDRLSKEIEEVGAALAGEDHQSCREVRDSLLRAVRGHAKVGRTSLTYETRHSRAWNVFLLQALEISIPAHAKNASDHRRFDALPDDPLVSAVPQVRRARLVARLVEQHLGIVKSTARPVGFDSDTVKKRPPLLVLQLRGSYLTYFGGGVWKVTGESLWTDDDSEQCEACGVKNTRRHRNTAAHASTSAARLHKALDFVTQKLLSNAGRTTSG